MDDQELIAGFLAGDPEIVDQARKWIRGAFTPYRQRFGSDLEDVEQEILLELTTALRDGRFRGQSRLATYVRTFAHHKCIDRLRAASRREWVDIDDLDLHADSPSAQERLSRSESNRLTLRVVEEMPESCRELWRMILEGSSYGEMSARLGVKEGALRARVLRCRRRALRVREKILAESRGGA